MIQIAVNKISMSGCNRLKNMSRKAFDLKVMSKVFISSMVILSAIEFVRTWSFSTLVLRVRLNTSSINKIAIRMYRALTEKYFFST